MSRDDGLVRVGVVARAHGIRGELVVEADGETLACVRPGATVWLGSDRFATEVTKIRLHKDRWLLALEALGDRTAAEAWRGAAVKVRADQLPELGDSEVWADDLVGYRVLQVDGSLVGVVRAVITAVPYDLLELKCGGATALVPMVRAWLVRLSRTDRAMTLRLPMGLVEVTAAPGSGGG